MNQLEPIQETPSQPAETQPEPSRKKKVRRFLFELVETIVLAAVLYFLIDAVVARVRVDNVSMEPTLYPGNFLLLNKLSYKWGAMKTGDIIVFHHDENGRKADYIKRLIGIPGDTVKVANGVVYVNNQALTEPYIMAEPKYDGSWVVPQGAVFVLGDNRNDSSDSHDWGFVQEADIIGKAIVIYWPFSSMRILSHPNMVSAIAP